MISSSILFGALAGVGLLMIASVLVPRRVSLGEVLAVRHRPPPLTVRPGDQAGQWGWAAWLGRPLVPPLAAVGLPRRALMADLRVCGRDVRRHAAEQATAIAAGLVGPPVLAGLVWAAGWSPGWLLPLWACLVAAPVAGLLVDLRVRRLAAARRLQLRHALSTLLDLSMMGLAGGAGVEQALTDAAAVGDGWAHQQLRQALRTARTTRVPLWGTLADLGRAAGVSELTELASAVALAGHEGAKIRATLGARATALRQRQAAETETAAAAATERMTLPSVLLLAAFMVAIGYPAVATILTGL
ncbi:MAG: type II secretion system F family protein [Natronosporangium sp.]